MQKEIQQIGVGAFNINMDWEHFVSIFLLIMILMGSLGSIRDLYRDYIYSFLLGRFLKKKNGSQQGPNRARAHKSLIMIFLRISWKLYVEMLISISWFSFFSLEKNENWFSHHFTVFSQIFTEMSMKCELELKPIKNQLKIH